MWIKAPPPRTWSGPVLSAVCPSWLQALLPPSLGMSGIPSQTLASPLPKASPSPLGIHQLWPFRNVLTPGTTRARKSRLIPTRIHHSSQRKSLQRAMEGSCPDLPIWSGRTDRRMDRRTEGRTDRQADRRMGGWVDGWKDRHCLEGTESGRAGLAQRPNRRALLHLLAKPFYLQKS